MSKTPFRLLTQAIANHLATSPGLVDVLVDTDRIAPLPREEARGVDVRLGRSVPTSVNYSYYTWTTVVAIDCMARTTAAASANDNADALLRDCYAAMQTFAATLPAQDLAVLDVGSEMVIEVGSDSADTGLTVITLLLPVQHETQQLTLEARP